MDIEQLRAYCLAKKGTSEDFPFGEDTLVIRVGRKMFALTTLTKFPPQVNLKCDPERALELRERYEAVQPGYHQNKRHWNTVTLNEGIPQREILEMIDHSYDLVFRSLSKKEREGLSG